MILLWLFSPSCIYLAPVLQSLRPRWMALERMGLCPQPRLLPKPKAARFRPWRRPPAWHPPSIVWALTAGDWLRGAPATLCTQRKCQGNLTQPLARAQDRAPHTPPILNPGYVGLDSGDLLGGLIREAKLSRLSLVAEKAPEPRGKKMRPTGRA